MLYIFTLFFSCASMKPSTSTTNTTDISSSRLFPSLQEKLDGWKLKKPATLTNERMESMTQLADWIAEKRNNHQPAKIIFVCTHNSRRSHMSQLWAQAAAFYLGLFHVETHSGGTESTAFNPRAVRALQRDGFSIESPIETSENPLYQTKLGERIPVYDSFSKRYDHESNPQSAFAAVMVCTSADTECPYVPGAEIRIAIPYIDPKLADDSTQESAVYQAKSEEIGREMLWMMEQVLK